MYICIYTYMCMLCETQMNHIYSHTVLHVMSISIFTYRMYVLIHVCTYTYVYIKQDRVASVSTPPLCCVRHKLTVEDWDEKERLLTVPYVWYKDEGGK
jgi:hypothetical protein